VRLHGDTRYGDLLLDNFGGEEWLGKTEKRRFLMHESVPKAVVSSALRSESAGVAAPARGQRNQSQRTP
jgi:hypothetical protein